MAKGGGGYFILIVIAFFIVVAGDNMLFGSQGYCMPNDTDCQPPATETVEETPAAEDVEEINFMQNVQCTNLPLDRVYSFTNADEAEKVSEQLGLGGEIHHHTGNMMILAGFFEDGTPDYRSFSGTYYMPGSSMYAFTTHYEELCP